ncbi:hypothetical protein LCM23_02080 [Cytobacillus kochii]|uniref:Uncharacterized protein n=2 Tax=Bacillaceae TaxID=186817 RepID=A0A248TEG8_9BACI|nr:hypothetical protein [Cytobacillus kochii]ASV66611.1 hypothetical protein CKF48_04315 [Cytobacillus kochii]MCA1024861.1 hypothetical protein [Cytobacillus kochii]
MTCHILACFVHKYRAESKRIVTFGVEGCEMMYRGKNKFTSIIIVLALTLMIYLIMNVFKHTDVYIVYRAGIGTFVITGFIITAIVVLYIKGNSFGKRR